MSDSRTTHGLGQHPGARFRCVVCRRFVKATERGVCPTCGFKPPTLTPQGKPDPRTWSLAATRARAYNEARDHGASSPWLWLLVAGAIAALAAALL